MTTLYMHIVWKWLRETL